MFGFGNAKLRGALEASRAIGKALGDRVTELAVHEREHAISLGVCALRGKMLIDEMDRRDAAHRAARGRVA